MYNVVYVRYNRLQHESVKTTVVCADDVIGFYRIIAYYFQHIRIYLKMLAMRYFAVSTSV